MGHLRPRAESGLVPQRTSTPSWTAAAPPAGPTIRGRLVPRAALASAAARGTGALPRGGLVRVDRGRSGLPARPPRGTVRGHPPRLAGRQGIRRTGETALGRPRSVERPGRHSRRPGAGEAILLHVEGMPLLYNLIVAEHRREVLDEDGDGASIERFRAGLAEWATREAAEDYRFEPDALWELVVRRGRRIPSPQRSFIETWSRRIAQLAPDSVADDARLRTFDCRPRASPQGPRARWRTATASWTGARGRRRPHGLPLGPRPQLLTDLHRGLAA